MKQAGGFSTARLEHTPQPTEVIVAWRDSFPYDRVDGFSFEGEPLKLRVENYKSTKSSPNKLRSYTRLPHSILSTQYKQ